MITHCHSLKESPFHSHENSITNVFREWFWEWSRRLWKYFISRPNRAGRSIESRRSHGKEWWMWAYFSYSFFGIWRIRSQRERVIQHSRTWFIQSRQFLFARSGKSPMLYDYSWCLSRWNRTNLREEILSTRQFHFLPAISAWEIACDLYNTHFGKGFANLLPYSHTHRSILDLFPWIVMLVI